MAVLSSTSIVPDAPGPLLPDLPFSVQAKSAASALVESIYVQHYYWNIQSITLAIHEGKMPSGSVESRPPIAFEEIEHTADRALRIYGHNLQELLLHAAGGLNSLMGTGDDIDSVQEKKSVEIEAMDAESLLVEWLSELAYWAEAEMLVFRKFDLQSVSPTHVKALIYGRRVTQMENHIKAVTYHNLEIVKTDTGLAATVVFDV
jgi:SHS2 domain-containing protein